MSKGIPRILGLASLLLVAACDHIPYYNESLDWFSWSKYDPEVNAIVAETPPPGNLEVRPASGQGAAMADPAPSTDQVSGVGGSVGTVTDTASTGTGVGTVASASAGGSSTSAPLVGIRNSVDGSVTWRSTRGTP